jgi:intein/homing endonuclease
VEEVFELESVVLELFVNGRLLETTEEHPFFAVGKGWTPARDLLAGD